MKTLLWPFSLYLLSSLFLRSVCMSDWLIPISSAAMVVLIIMIITKITSAFFIFFLLVWVYLFLFIRIDFTFLGSIFLTSFSGSVLPYIVFLKVKAFTFLLLILCSLVLPILGNHTKSTVNSLAYNNHVEFT